MPPLAGTTTTPGMGGRPTPSTSQTVCPHPIASEPPGGSADSASIRLTGSARMAREVVAGEPGAIATLLRFEGAPKSVRKAA